MSISIHTRYEDQPLDVKALEAFFMSETVDPWFDAPLRTKPADRRRAERLSPEHYRWLRAVRQKYGAEVWLVNLSLGGMLIETPTALEPQAKVVFELVGTDSTILAPSRILRCDRIEGGTVRYRCAISFARPLTLPVASVPSKAATPTPGAPASTRPAPAPVAARPAARPPVQPAASVPQAAATGATATAYGSKWQKVVARYTDGTTLRGYTNNFHSARTQLHVADHPTATKPTLVPLEKLKALFFVRDFEGDPTRTEQKEFIGAALGRKIEVSFHDGETLVGTTMSYQYEGTGFFVQPADHGSNNLRIFVLMSAVRQVRFLR